MCEEATMFRFMKTKVAAAVLVIAAISAPTASAGPIDLVPPTASDTKATVDGSARSPLDGSAAPTVQTVGVPSEGFDWGDAAIGAGAMLTLLGLGTGGMVIARRRGEPVATG
jgi:hypothetical protein